MGMSLDTDMLFRNFWGVIAAMVALSGMTYHFKKDVSKLEEKIENVYNDKIKLIEREMLQFALNLSKKDKLDDDDKNGHVTIMLMNYSNESTI